MDHVVPKKYIVATNPLGLDMDATGAQISKLIDESGLNDKQLSAIMHLSVQSVNKWRHGRNLPDIENLFILSRILGKRVDDFLIPLAPKPLTDQIKTEPGFGPIPRRLLEYVIRYSQYRKVLRKVR